MKPLVSIILPVYNGKRTIKEAIESILTQTFKSWELLIINDGSTDNTDKIVQSINNQQVKYFKTDNRGIARTLNFGIKMANADIICRMDVDDICKPNRLQIQYDYLKEHPNVGLVSSLVKYQGNRSMNTGYALYVDEINKLTSHEGMFTKRFVESPIAHPSVMFRKSLVRQYGGYNESRLPEDYELWLRWMDNDVVFGKVNEVLLRWQDSEDRLSRSHSNYDLDNFYELKIKYLASHLKKQDIGVDNMWVWGTGRQINKWIAMLTENGLEVKGRIDVKTSSTDDSVIHFTALDKLKSPLIISLVRDRKGKKEIEIYLKQRGYVEGKNFFMLS